MNYKVVDTSWGEFTDELQHESIPTGKALLRLVNETAYKTANDNPAFYKKDFYIVALIGMDLKTKTEKLLAWPRFSCPTPVYDQHVWKYCHEKPALEYLWSIPIKSKCEYYIKNHKTLLQDPAQRNQTSMCLMFDSGDLLEWVKKENKEDPKKEGFFLTYKQPEGLIH